MKKLLTTTALILAMTAGANASETPTGSTVLAGGPLYAASQNMLFCFFTNIGTTNLTATAQQIFALGSTTAIASSSTCPDGLLLPNQQCYIAPTNSLSSGDSYTCKVTFNTTTTKIRGALEIYDSAQNPLATVELR
jgi:hypothetical protein